MMSAVILHLGRLSPCWSWLVHVKYISCVGRISAYSICCCCACFHYFSRSIFYCNTVCYYIIYRCFPSIRRKVEYLCEIWTFRSSNMDFFSIWKIKDEWVKGCSHFCICKSSPCISCWIINFRCIVIA